MIKVNDVVITPTTFPDKTKLIKCDPNDDYCLYNEIEWYYENDEELFTLYCLVKHLEKYMPCKLYMPYIPNARMDRVKDKKEVFTLKYFADFINSLNFIEVVVLDPHSNVSTALIDRVVAVQPSDYIKQAITKSNPDVIFFPDEGAMKRYSDLITCDCGRVFGMKMRDWATGNILGLEVHGETDKLEGAKVLIIDDICSKGGTFYHSAKALKALGAANIDLYITHCEDTIFEGELLKDNGLIDKIYTTNSLFRDGHPKMEVFEI